MTPFRGSKERERVPIRPTTLLLDLIPSGPHRGAQPV